MEEDFYNTHAAILNLFMQKLTDLLPTQMYTVSPASRMATRRSLRLLCSKSNTSTASMAPSDPVSIANSRYLSSSSSLA